MAPRKIDLLGKRVGRWQVLEVLPQPGETTYWCVCDCGTERGVRASRLKAGNSKSCGCLKAELVRARSTKHGACSGGRRSRAYNSWQCMLERCRSAHYKGFKDYGGRGITVCKRWHTFENFIDDMGQPPPGMSIDRIDTDGNYEPQNCRWATAKEQSHGRRDMKLTTVKAAAIRHLKLMGATRRQLAESFGVSITTIYNVTTWRTWA